MLEATLKELVRIALLQCSTNHAKMNSLLNIAELICSDLASLPWTQYTA